jgi:UDP-N-acetyl-D-galactosamine dehydrogenase
VNDDMGMFVANKVVKLMINKGHTIKGANVLILGVTFKENCPDVRNTKVVDIYNELTQFGLNVDVYDPWADSEEIQKEYKLKLLPKLNGKKYDAVIVAVAHDDFSKVDFNGLKENNTVIFDTKSILDRSLVDARL